MYKSGRDINNVFEQGLNSAQLIRHSTIHWTWRKTKLSNCSLKRAPFSLCTQCDHLIKRFYLHAQTQGGRAKATSSLILTYSTSITPQYFLDVTYNKNLKNIQVFFFQVPALTEITAWALRILFTLPDLFSLLVTPQSHPHPADHLLDSCRCSHSAPACDLHHPRHHSKPRKSPLCLAMRWGEGGEFFRAGRCFVWGWFWVVLD